MSDPVTHDLFLILEKIMLFRNDAEHLRDALATLTPYAVEIRYPDDWHMPSELDAREARGAAGEVLSWFENALPEVFEDFQNG